MRWTAQAPYPQPDTASLAPRTPPGDVLGPFRDDPAFHYEEPPASESLLGRLWEQIREILGRSFDSAYGPLLEWLLYGLLTLVVGWAILKLLRMEPSGTFRRVPMRRLRFDEEVARIEKMDFETLIDAAARAGDLRRAVRLLYLRALRDLSRSGLLTLQPEKTNRQYERELLAPLRPEFSRLTYLYDHVWYGHFVPSEAAFTEARARFSAFTETLDRHRAEG